MKRFKTSELQRGMIFHIQDRDRGFVFIGRVRFYGLDFIQFDVLPKNEAPSCRNHGIYTFNIGSSFSLHGMKWDEKRNGYVYDESIITSEYLVIDDVDKDNDQHTKFDVKKAEDLLYEGKWHIQDHDTKFQFYGIFKSIHPDELTFHIMDRTIGISRGTYAFPAGSHFNLHKLRLDKDKKEWIFSSGPNHVIDWKDITETDDDEVDVKEEKDMKLDSWKDCVIKDNAWFVNDQIKDGDVIDRLKTDTIDIKGKMKIANISYGMIHIESDNIDGIIGTINLEITRDMRIFKPDSPDNPGILVQQQKCKFNPELRAGKFYRVVNSHLFLQYVMYVRSINGDSIYANLINMITDLDNKSSVTVTGKMLDIAELSEYKFDEIDIFKNCFGSIRCGKMV